VAMATRDISKDIADCSREISQGKEIKTWRRKMTKTHL